MVEWGAVGVLRKQTKCVFLCEGGGGGGGGGWVGTGK